MVVFATTFTVPCRVSTACAESVTSWNNVCIAPSFNDFKGRLWNDIGRSARFPVDTPPTVLDVGNVNWWKVKYLPVKSSDDPYRCDLSTIVCEPNDHVHSRLHNLE
jgi:hypothetical protein